MAQTQDIIQQYQYIHPTTWQHVLNNYELLLLMSWQDKPKVSHKSNSLLSSPKSSLILLSRIEKKKKKTWYLISLQNTHVHLQANPNANFRLSQNALLHHYQLQVDLFEYLASNLVILSSHHHSCSPFWWYWSHRESG